jgi:hypothetical protein
MGLNSFNIKVEGLVGGGISADVIQGKNIKGGKDKKLMGN